MNRANKCLSRRVETRSRLKHGVGPQEGASSTATLL